MNPAHYAKILVASNTYHGRDALTYTSNEPLTAGTIVRVPLRNKMTLGVVSAITPKPAFPVKPVQDIPQIPVLPNPTMGLLTWLAAYYPAPSGATTSLFLPHNLPKSMDDTDDVSAASTPTVAAARPALTQDQRTAIQAISGAGLHVLHGETGSGKTRVYIELAGQTLRSGSSVLVLTPEIGLTSQLVEQFRAAYGNRVLLVHSKLSIAARNKIWLQILTHKNPLIVIGPRSALFAPLRSVGLIVIDESHEPAYKQDNAPHYHASHVAGKLASLHNATLVLGSATPLVTDYTVAKAKSRPVIRMSQTARSIAAYKRNVSVVDLRDRRNLTKNPYLSDKLIEYMHRTLAKNEQILLFLNRRGTARLIFCERCSWQAVCPHCDLPLVYHGDTHQAQCHICSYRTASPPSCPNCHNSGIVFKSVGTKAIVEYVAKQFPEHKIQRFDTDNKKGERIEEHFDSMYRGNIDIIVGTQVVAKGIDLPKLGLVGVIMADTGLSLPDFSASERTYQLLRQVVGRIGRGHRSSTAVIQTYNPGSPLISAALNGDWNSFYETELQERRQFRFPPFCHLLKLTCKRASSAAAERASRRLANMIRELSLDAVIEGPAPSFHEKVQNKYQWQLVVKAKRRSDLLKIIDVLPSNWLYDIDPMNLL